MKPETERRLLICGIGVLAISSIVYCSLVLLTLLAAKGITFKEFDSAAWTQAVGSVGAILVAVWVSHRQSKHVEAIGNAQAAGGVRLKSSLLRTIATLEEVALQTAYDHHLNPYECARREMERDDWKSLKAARRNLSLAVGAMSEFPASTMTSGVELMFWTMARIASESLVIACDHIGGSEPDIHSAVFAEVQRLHSLAGELDRVADLVHKGHLSPPTLPEHS